MELSCRIYIEGCSARLCALARMRVGARARGSREIMEKREPKYKPYHGKQEERVYRYSLLDASCDAFGLVGVDMGGLGCCSRYGVYSGTSINSLEGSLVIGGLQHCHSVACCPVCSYSLGIERCNEIGSFIWCVRKQGFGVYLVSLTCSHKMTDDLALLIKRMMSASSAMWRNGSLRRSLKDWGYLGRITSFEVMTHGVNGFHPHLHILLIGSDDLDVDAVGADLLDYWSKSLKSEGLKCNEHGCDVMGYKGVTDYITKMQTELSLLNVTKDMSKGGESMSPMNLLSCWNIERDVSFAREWVDYCIGVKGKRITVWSRGLRDVASMLRKQYNLEIPDDKKEMNGLIIFDDSRQYEKLKPWQWRLLVEMIYQDKIDKVLRLMDDKGIGYYFNRRNYDEFKKIVYGMN